MTEHKRIRKAELITPPNRIKEKVGSGGIDEVVMQKAQDLVENNSVDFKPIATMLVDLLNEGIQEIRTGVIKDEEAIESLIYPAMQLKAQGGMFHYPLITEICNILVNFLETVEEADKDVLDIVIAHKMAINVVLGSEIKQDGGDQGKALRDALMEACNRYYKKHKE